MRAAAVSQLAHKPYHFLPQQKGFIFTAAPALLYHNRDNLNLAGIAVMRNTTAGYGRLYNHLWRFFFFASEKIPAGGLEQRRWSFYGWLRE